MPLLQEENQISVQAVDATEADKHSVDEGHDTDTYQPWNAGLGYL